jgi:hypothetical protein
MRYKKNDPLLPVVGYEIYHTRYADSILNDQFPDAKKDLENVLSKFFLREEQIIAGGGGRSEIAKTFTQILIGEHWKEATRETKLYLNGELAAKETIEMDHLKSYPNGDLAVKIQWNSKDPVFYTNLEDFRKLHYAGGLAIGIMVTRGKSLQDELFFVYQRYLKSQLPLNLERLQKPLSLSQRAIDDIGKMIVDQGNGAINQISSYMTSSKFGTATTHMEKLIEQVEARAGDPCPLILIGIGKQRLIQ